MTYTIPSEQEQYAARARALAQVEAVADASHNTPMSAPDGSVHIVWRHFDGFERAHEITQWRRIDEGLMRAGEEFEVRVEARQYRDLRLPLYSVTATARLTCNREDVSTLYVGNVAVPSGWRYGVRLIGAVLLPEDLTSGATPQP